MNKRTIGIIVVALITLASLQIAKASPLAGKPVLSVNFQLPPPPPPPPPLGRPHFRHHRHHRYYRHHHSRVVVHLPPPPPAPPRP